MGTTNITAETPAPAPSTETVVIASSEPVTEPAEAAKTLEQLTAELATWKGHARDWEGKAKLNKAAADTVAALEAEKLTNEERLQLELDTLRGELTAASAVALKASVASATGVTAAESQFLTGATEAELNAQAAALIAMRAPVIPAANDVSAAGKLGDHIGTGAVLTDAEFQALSAVEKLRAAREGRVAGINGAPARR